MGGIALGAILFLLSVIILFCIFKFLRFLFQDFNLDIISDVLHIQRIPFMRKLWEIVFGIIICFTALVMIVNLLSS